MMTAPLHIEGLAWFAPFAKLDDVADGIRAELPRPDLSLLDRTLRRGLSDVTRYFMHVAKSALDDAQRGPENIPTVFASAFGEIAVAEALFAHAYDEDGSSPARFRNSVHNTAPGLFSISAHNTQPSTAICAGFATTAMALLEASTQLASDCERLLLVLAEEPLPRTLSAGHRHGALAVAFVLARLPSTRTRASLLGLRRVPEPGAPNQVFGPDEHPLWPALELARALATPTRTTVQLSDGACPYLIDVEPMERR